MGVVYQARQTRLGRVVALKMILSGAHAGADDLARFRTEAEAIARLQHPHIVQIYEVGEHGGLPYFSLEFCPGGSLAQKLAGTPLPPREAAVLVETLARAMQAAHDKGVIHRDLKPANVLLAEDGTPKVTDFGLAKKLDEAGRTASGAVMGTPSYMAPEQAGGRSKELGPACDVYALGALLYECLTGRPPFQAPTHLDTLLQVVSDDPVRVRALQPKVPRDLETICLKCLRKEPGKRYGSASALAEDLRRFLADEPIRARRVSWLERVWKSIRRRPAFFLLLLVALPGGFIPLGLMGAGVTLALIVAGGGSFGVAFLLLGAWLYRGITAPLREAKEKLQAARRVIDEVYIQVARRWLTDEPRPDDLQRQFLIKMQDLYEILVVDRDRDSSINRWSGLAHFHVGQVYHRALGNPVQADRSYARAIAIQAQLCQQYLLVEVYRRDLANSLHWRGVLLQAQGLRVPDAEQLHGRARGLPEGLTAAEKPGGSGEWSRGGNRAYSSGIVFAGSPVEAGIVRSFLEANGITAHLGDDHIGTAAPPHGRRGWGRCGQGPCRARGSGEGLRAVGRPSHAGVRLPLVSCPAAYDSWPFADGPQFRQARLLPPPRRPPPPSSRPRRTTPRTPTPFCWRWACRRWRPAWRPRRPSSC
jgi:hypothetical protein